MERIINIDKKHALNGSFTVEMSLLMPMILFLVMDHGMYKDIFLLS